MKKIIFLCLIFLFSCGTKEFEISKENIKKSYVKENRSLNLEKKNIKNFVNLNGYMTGTEINNIFIGNNEIQLIDVSGFEKLGKLEINDNNIRFISSLRLPKGIRHLNLSGNRLDSLKGIEKYSNLKTLDLSYNKLEDEDIKIESLKRLKYLNLEGNKISEKMLEKVKEFNKLYLLKNEVPYKSKYK